MERKSKTKQIKFDPEEKDLLASFERNEWKTIKNFEAEKKNAREIALKTLHKDVRINIRLSSSDIANIKQIAAYEGLPYRLLFQVSYTSLLQDIYKLVKEIRNFQECS